MRTNCLAAREGVLHLLKPIVDPASPIMHAIEVNVAAGQPVEVAVEGPGIEELCTSVLHLGQVLQPFKILLQDDAGAAQHLPILALTDRSR